MSSNKRLGTPYKRGKSDVIDNFAPNGAAAAGEGLAVCKAADGTVKAVSALTDIVLGVAGVLEPSKRQSVVRTGLEVYVQLDSGVSPSEGEAVYVTAAGKFTNAAKAGENNNIAVNALFASGKVTAEDSAGKTCDAAAIDFPGGL